MLSPYLAAKANNFVYEGYTDLSQLGKYFTLTIDKSKTRLYSCVNFLR